MTNKILSDESLTEDYEDLVFKKVFAIRCKEESKKIFDEIREREKQETEGKKVAEKLFDKKERKENLHIIGNIFKKGFVFAASFIFVVIISLSSVVVASTDVRDVVTDIIYHLVFEENERYTKISSAETTDFIDPELYNWEGAYAPTYMPEGFEFAERADIKNKHTIYYSLDTKDIVITQFENTSYRIDTEDALEVKHTEINNSDAIIVIKNDYIIVCCFLENNMLWIYGNYEESELVKIAESMKKIK